jgi:hypothetical protein
MEGETKSISSCRPYPRQEFTGRDNLQPKPRLLLGSDIQKVVIVCHQKICFAGASRRDHDIVVGSRLNFGRAPKLTCVTVILFANRFSSRLIKGSGTPRRDKTSRYSRSTSSLTIN